MKKVIISILLVSAVLLAACGSKSQTAQQRLQQQQTGQSSVQNNTSSKLQDSTNITTRGTSDDAPNAVLKNSTPVKVAPETVKKNEQSASKAKAKLSSVDNALNSIGDFSVTDNSGLN